jgi:NTE family protein
MKGLAHIGVLKVLARHGIVPSSYIGTSVGSLIAAMAAGGMMPEEIERIGVAVQRQDILDYDWLGLLLRRGRNRSIYRGKAYHDWVRRILPTDRFQDLKAGLYMTTVNVNDGREVVWGMPGLNDVPIHDCVVASCAIPGVYPAKQIRGHWFVDGGWADPLPVRVAVYLKASLIIAVHLDHEESDSPANAQEAGLYDMIERGQSMLSRAITRFDLRYFKDAPLALIEPRVQHHSLFQFDGLEECIRAGEEAAEDAVAHHPLLRTLGSASEERENERTRNAGAPGLVEPPGSVSAA